MNSPPLTLVHSDFNLDNMMFGDPDQMPFALIDWQFLHIGRGVWDIGLFLCQNLTSEIRRSVEHELLEEYVRVLHSHRIDYSLDDVLTDYRYSILGRYGALIPTIAAMPFTPEQIQMHIDVLLPRCISAIEDNDAESVLD